MSFDERIKDKIEEIENLVSQLQEIEEDLKIQEELLSIKYLGSHLFSNLSIYFLRTSKDFSLTTTEKLSESYSNLWMSWGTMQSGKCLTAKTLMSHKIENECSLSDILEEQVEEKYFLSQKKIQIFLNI